LGRTGRSSQACTRYQAAISFSNGFTTRDTSTSDTFQRQGVADTQRLARGTTGDDQGLFSSRTKLSLDCGEEPTPEISAPQSTPSARPSLRLSPHLHAHLRAKAVVMFTPISIYGTWMRRTFPCKPLAWDHIYYTRPSGLNSTGGGARMIQRRKRKVGCRIFSTDSSVRPCHGLAALHTCEYNEVWCGGVSLEGVQIAVPLLPRSTPAVDP
jgi:hypothetical protein